MEPDDREYMRKRFRWFSPLYDLVVRPLAGIRDQVVDEAGIPEGSRVLDVATGTGKQAFSFATHGYDVVGLDLSEDMLAVARRKNTFRNAAFLVGDASDLPFEDGEFDAAVVFLALHEMPPPVREKALDEMARVTKPGGTLIAVDYSLDGGSVLLRGVDRVLGLFESRHYRESKNMELASLLERHGVEILSETPILKGVARIVTGSNAADRPPGRGAPITGHEE